MEESLNGTPQRGWHFARTMVANPRKLRSVHGERDRIAFSYGEMSISIAESLVSQKDGSASLEAR